MKNKVSPQEKLIKLQKRIYRSLKAETEALLGETPPAIQQYDRENRRDFLVPIEKLKKVQKENFIADVRNADVIFIGDYHTFDQAQRTALRLMREMIDPSEPWYIALEMISSEHQVYLDQFMDDQIHEKEFLQKVSYETTWGFPWKNYLPLFEWAKENKIKAIALNRPTSLFLSKSIEELQLRDQWAAGIITELFANSPENQKKTKPKVVVFYGELHVGSRHLPHQLDFVSQSFLGKKLNWVTVHQNDDRLFWKLVHLEKEYPREIIQLKNNIYCIFSSTPWAKLQSLNYWIEGDFSSLSENVGAEDSDERSLDYLSMLSHYGGIISSFFDIQSPSFETLNPIHLGQSHLIDQLIRSRQLLPTERTIVRFKIRHHQRFYLPKLGTAYLGSPSQNGLAELSGIYVFRQLTQYSDIFPQKNDDFFRLVLEQMFGFFGSLILNPRRKIENHEDHLERIKRLKAGAQAQFPSELQSRNLTVQLLNTLPFSSSDQIPISLSYSENRPQSEINALLMSARYLGQILGTQLYFSALQEKISISALVELFFTKPSQENHFTGQISAIYKKLF